jgi:ArsR family transcriptional regulator
VNLATTPRADLFRLLGDESRLRLLALCAEEELTVGELATLLDESQPQVTRKSQPLRDAGLLASRRDGTRTLLRAQPTADEVTRTVLDAALAEGRALCTRDGSLARIAALIAQREEASRRYFDGRAADDAEAVAAPGNELPAWLPVIAPLLPGRALAVDAGTGDGTFLPLLSPLYDRVVAIDRSAASLARCAARLAAWGLPNVRLRQGDVDDAGIAEELHDKGGADLVLVARVLRHAARPGDVIVAAARLVRPGGHLVIVDHLPHDDESVRDEGAVWLGFEPAKLRTWLEAARLEVTTLAPLPTSARPALQIAVGHRAARHLH